MQEVPLPVLKINEERRIGTQGEKLAGILVFTWSISGTSDSPALQRTPVNHEQGSFVRVDDQRSTVREFADCAHALEFWTKCPSRERDRLLRMKWHAEHDQHKVQFSQSHQSPRVFASH